MKHIYLSDGREALSDRDVLIWLDEQKERRHKEYIKVLKLIVKVLAKK